MIYHVVVTGCSEVPSYIVKVEAERYDEAEAKARAICEGEKLGCCNSYEPIPLDRIRTA